jgi:hypothetical protein
MGGIVMPQELPPGLPLPEPNPDPGAPVSLDGSLMSLDLPRRFMPDDELVQIRITENLEFALDHYAEMLGSAPTYVTYYNRITEESTQDKGLDAVYAVVGTDSPIRYRRIETFPAYKLQQIVLGLQDGTYGLEADIASECLVLPHTIKPYVDDLVVVLVPGGFGYVVFQVTAAEPSVTGSKRFYKLAIKRVEKTLEQCEAQTSEEAIFSVQDFEAGRRAVLLRADSEVLGQARKQRARLVADYRRLFYDSRVASFVCRHMGLNLVHFGIHELLESGRVLEFDRPFYDVCTVMTPPDPGMYNILLERFDGTLYGCVKDHGLTPGFSCDSFIPLPINGRGSIFTAYRDKFHEAWDNTPGSTPSGSIYYSEEGFADAVRAKEPYRSLVNYGDAAESDTPGYEIENFIIRYTNGLYERVSDVVDDAAAVRISPNLRSFLLAPCVMYAVKRVEDLLTSLVQER